MRVLLCRPGSCAVTRAPVRPGQYQSMGNVSPIHEPRQAGRCPLQHARASWPQPCPDQHVHCPNTQPAPCKCTPGICCAGRGAWQGPGRWRCQRVPLQALAPRPTCALPQHPTCSMQMHPWDMLCRPRCMAGARALAMPAGAPAGASARAGPQTLASSRTCKVTGYVFRSARPNQAQTAR